MNIYNTSIWIYMSLYACKRKWSYSPKICPKKKTTNEAPTSVSQPPHGPRHPCVDTLALPPAWPKTCRIIAHRNQMSKGTTNAHKDLTTLRLGGVIPSYHCTVLLSCAIQKKEWWDELGFFWNWEGGNVMGKLNDWTIGVKFTAMNLPRGHIKTVYLKLRSSWSN